MFYQNDLQRLMSSPEEVCRNMAFSLALRCIQNIPRWESIDCIMFIECKLYVTNTFWLLLSLLTLVWLLNFCQPSCTVWAAGTLMWCRQPWGTCRNMCCSVKVFCRVGLSWVDVVLIVLHWRYCMWWIFLCKPHFVDSCVHPFPISLLVSGQSFF